jgi:hypothetical protein
MESVRHWAHPVAQEEQMVPLRYMPYEQLVQTAASVLMHLAQLLEAVQLVQTWLIWIRSLLALRMKPAGQVRQEPSIEQELSAWQAPLVMVYPWTQLRQAKGLLFWQVAQGVMHLYWHWKFWLRMRPSTQEKQAKAVQASQPQGQVVPVTVEHTLLASSMKPGAQTRQVVRESGEQNWHPSGQGAHPPEVKVYP